MLSVENRRIVRLEDAQGQNQEQEQLFVAKLSDAPSPQVQIEPVDGHLQIDDEMIMTHAEVVCQVAEGIQDDPVQLESTLRVNPSTSLPPKQNMDPSYPLSPPVTFYDLGPIASQLPSSLSVLPTRISPKRRKEMLSATLCAYANQGT